MATESLWGAIIGGASALAAAGVANFAGEMFKRRLDAKALAAALAGELESHTSELPNLKTFLQILAGQIAAGKVKKLPDFTNGASSPLFDANAGKIGLLGPDLAGRTAATYERIRAFRAELRSLSVLDADTQRIQMEGHCSAAIMLIDEWHGKGKALISDLQRFAGNPLLADICKYVRRALR